jgi:prevent-host-death family protein
LIDLVHVVDYILDMLVVNIHEAKTNFSKFVDRAHGGEEVIIAKAGKPWVRLMPLAAQAERVPGRYHDAPGSNFFEALPDEELDAWES